MILRWRLYQLRPCGTIVVQSIARNVAVRDQIIQGVVSPGVNVVVLTVKTDLRGPHGGQRKSPMRALRIIAVNPVMLEQVRKPAKKPDGQVLYREYL